MSDFPFMVIAAILALIVFLLIAMDTCLEQIVHLMQG